MIIFGVEAVLLLALIVGFYVIRQLDKIQKPEVKAEEIQVNPDIQETTVETMSG